MQTNEVAGFMLLLVLNFFLYIFMGWEIIQTRAYFHGFKSTEIDAYLEQVPSLHRKFYRSLEMKARPDKDIPFTVLLMALYVGASLLFLATLVYRLSQATSASVSITTLGLILILIPTYIFFLSAALRVESVSR